MRGKIEQFHRELKQTTCIEKNQWRLADIARQIQQTGYRIKHGLLDNYLCQQLKNPFIKMRFIDLSPLMKEAAFLWLL
ncbi:MAG TPA: hypothetical protein VM571_02670 [Noviherbaspirillum sp.]|nr:hypothetical protein [Noviherbaspirillum sp.]